MKRPVFVFLGIAVAAAVLLLAAEAGQQGPSVPNPADAKAAVAKLVEEVRKGDNGAILMAVDKVKEIGGTQAAVVELIETSSDAKPGMRSAAVFALGELGPVTKDVVPALIERLKDTEAPVRFKAIGALESIGPRAKASLPALFRLTEEDKDPITRLSVVMALWKIDPQPKHAQLAVASFARLLKIDNAEIRKIGAIALKDMGPAAKEAVPTLEEALKSSAGAARVKVAWALWNVDRQKKAIEALVGALKDKKPEVRRDAADALRAIGSPAKSAVPALEELFKDDDDEVWLHAKMAIIGIDVANEAALRQQRKFQKKDVELQNIFHGMQQVDEGGSGVLELRLALEKPKSFLDGMGMAQRIKAGEASKHTPGFKVKKGEGTKLAIGYLANALLEEDTKVRQAAVVALLVLVENEPAAKKAVPALIHALKDKDKLVRSMAANALGYIGLDAAAAIEPLKETLKDDEKEVREAADKALKKIEAAKNP